jgi:hypothetical protein
LMFQGSKQEQRLKTFLMQLKNQDQEFDHTEPLH